jgi:hypothetical protein
MMTTQIDLRDFAVGNHRIACPTCAKKASDKTLGITVHSHDDIVAHCFRCGYTQSHRGESSTSSQPRIQPPQPTFKREGISEYWLDVWKRSEPISCVAKSYLESRNCVTPPKDSHLKWHPQLKHPSGYVGAALVALVTDQHTGKALSIHRTWITSTGKADVNPPRLFAAGQSIKGGVIRLWGDEYVGGGLGIAEGIETALSLAHAMTPVWAVMDAGHLAAFEVMAGVECLTIAADNDAAGIAAVEACASRWINAGHTVYVTKQQENDLNDYVMGQA